MAQNHGAPVFLTPPFGREQHPPDQSRCSIGTSPRRREKGVHGGVHEKFWCDGEQELESVAERRQWASGAYGHSCKVQRSHVEKKDVHSHLCSIQF